MRLLLVDGSEIFRIGMRQALSAAGDIEIVAEADTARAAEAAARTHGPEVVVADANLFERDAFVLASALRAAAPAARVVVLGTSDSEALIRQALLAGASGYVSKSESAAGMLAAIREVAAGRVARPLPIATADGSASSDQRPEARGAAALARLSAREREIFDLIIWGQTNKQVAQRLGISVKTVETHRSHINGKLQVHSAAELVRLASLCGVLAAGAPPELAAPVRPGPRLVAEG